VKILYCEKCESLVKLTRKKIRSCECGKIVGRYLGKSQAEIFLGAPAISIVISTPSFKAARKRLKWTQKHRRKSSREDYKSIGSVVAWIRPNSGPGNPHTRERTSKLSRSKRSAS
jgi:hypothetical protein